MDYHQIKKQKFSNKNDYIARTDQKDHIKRNNELKKFIKILVNTSIDFSIIVLLVTNILKLLF